MPWKCQCALDVRHWLWLGEDILIFHDLSKLHHVGIYHVTSWSWLWLMIITILSVCVYIYTHTRSLLVEVELSYKYESRCSFLWFPRQIVAHSDNCQNPIFKGMKRIWGCLTHARFSTLSNCWPDTVSPFRLHSASDPKDKTLSFPKLSISICKQEALGRIKEAQNASTWAKLRLP